jgi:hypothetical protein
MVSTELVQSNTRTCTFMFCVAIGEVWVELDCSDRDHQQRDDCD